MIIVIDGYNFLKSVTGSKFISDHVMHDWIVTFQEYIHLRGNELVLVFDAGPSLYPTVEHHGAVEVVYAGQHQTADDFLKKWLVKKQGCDVLLVTSDRDIRNWADTLRVTSISSQDFSRVLASVMQHEQRQLVVLQQTMYKTKEHNASDAALDDLMELGSRGLVSGNFKVEYEGLVRVRDGKKASKADKSVMKKIDKI